MAHLILLLFPVFGLKKKQEEKLAKLNKMCDETLLFAVIVCKIFRTFLISRRTFRAFGSKDLLLSEKSESKSRA